MKNYLLFLVVSGIFLAIVPIFESKSQIIEAIPFIFSSEEELEGSVIVCQNSLLPLTNPINTDSQIKRILVVITAYSSSPWETDDNPYITAAGTLVREGIIANNMLPFGTKVRIPELFGEQIFVVEDRMSWTKGYYHVDIWFPSYWEALNFGARRTYIEILES